MVEFIQSDFLYKRQVWHNSFHSGLMEQDKNDNQNDQSSKKRKLEEQDFEQLKIADRSWLSSLERVSCPKCERKRKFYCYDCFIAFGDKVPKVKLPFDLDMCVLVVPTQKHFQTFLLFKKKKIETDSVHHPSESPTKSTAFHAKILAPEQTKIYEYPEFPDYKKQDKPNEKILLLFPSKVNFWIGIASLC